MMKAILFFYEYLFAFPIILILTALTAITTIVGCALGSNNVWGYYPAKIWSRIFCVLSLVRVKVSGRQNIDKNQSYVFVSNHQGTYDIFLLYGYLNHNFKWVMKQSLRDMPLLGKACDSAGHIFIDRTNPKAIIRTIETTKERLIGGASVIIFPEGTRSADGKLQRFKKGAYQLATDLNMPIVPLTIDGSYKILSKSLALVSPGKLTLKIHPPIFPDKEKGHDIEELMSKSYEIISSGLERS